MRSSSVATVIAGLFIAQAVLAQGQQPPEPAPSPNPVEEQEVDASQKDKPAEGTGQPATTSPLAAASAPAKDAKWDVNAPLHTTLRQRYDILFWIGFTVHTRPKQIRSLPFIPSPLTQNTAKPIYEKCG